MELRTFVAQTLIGIQRGIQDAIARGEDSNAAINPCFRGTRNPPQHMLQLVEFDLAVTAADDLDGTGTGSIHVSSGKLGKDKKGKEWSGVSRIQFAVPILPASQTIEASDYIDPVAESLRRAAKVASAPASAETEEAPKGPSNSEAAVSEPEATKQA